MADFGTHDDDARDLLPRFRVAYFALALVAGIIFTRLWFLQIVDGRELREYSEKNRLKENRIPSPRGLILDREGRILVDNTMGFDVTISPQYATKLESTATAIAPIVGQTPEKIIETVKVSRRKNGPFMPVRLKENLTLDEVFRLKMLRLDNPGLNVQETVLRFYPLEQNGAQLFGYVGEISKRQMEALNKKRAAPIPFQQGDIIGQSGIEEVWDLRLRGRDGLDFIEVDAHGRESTKDTSQFTELRPQKEVPGHNLVLTIDKDIQEAAYKAMTEQKDATGPRIGAVVVMKTNGEILAWVVTPTFNPNKFAKGIAPEVWSELINDPFKPLRNKPIQDHYSPGSALKPFIAAAGLQEKIITANTIVSAPGMMMFGGRPYHDSLKGGHGNINVGVALERSSNIFFYKLGIQLGIDNMYKYATLFGLGQKAKVQIANEVAGVFPNKEWKLKVTGEPWQPGENLSNAIGQGFVRVTLLQLLLGYNAIGNGGQLVRPLLVKKILSENHQVVEEFEPELIRDITVPDQNGTRVSPETLATVRKGLWQVANGPRGTAQWWKIPGVEFAGKTGTTQLQSFSAAEIYDRCENRPLQMRHHGTFAGYVPADKPDIAIAVLAEHSCHGNTGSVPVFRDIARAYIEKYRPELIKDKSKKPLPVPAKIEADE
jgi:penicillin-binding protein 2